MRDLVEVRDRNLDMRGPINRRINFTKHLAVVKQIEKEWNICDGLPFLYLP